METDVWTMPPSSPTQSQLTTQQSYVYWRQSESTEENHSTAGLNNLSSIENALPVVTNTPSIESTPKHRPTAAWWETKFNTSFQE